MKRKLMIGDVIELKNGQKFRVIYTKRNYEDVYIFVGIRDWNVYFETDNLDYGVGDEIHEGSDLSIVKILSKDETPTLIAIVG
jgi:hypothetical protein